MPVYMFTFHAYRSWMPDRRRGYVKRAEGILPPDPDMAQFYRRDANHDAVVFTPRVVISRAIDARANAIAGQRPFLSPGGYAEIVQSMRQRRKELVVGMPP